MTYFHMEEPHYHRRGVVSLCCSGWEGVGPTRYGRQTNCSAVDGILSHAMSGVRWVALGASTNRIWKKQRILCFDCALRNAYLTL